MWLTSWPLRPIWLPICWQLLMMWSVLAAKLRGQPRYTLEELLAQCDPNATPPGEMDWGQD